MQILPPDTHSAARVTKTAVLRQVGRVRHSVRVTHLDTGLADYQRRPEAGNANKAVRVVRQVVTVDIVRQSRVRRCDGLRRQLARDLVRVRLDDKRIDIVDRVLQSLRQAIDVVLVCSLCALSRRIELVAQAQLLSLLS